MRRRGGRAWTVHLGCAGSPTPRSRGPAARSARRSSGRWVGSRSGSGRSTSWSQVPVPPQNRGRGDQAMTAQHRVGRARRAWLGRPTPSEASGWFCGVRRSRGVGQAARCPWTMIRGQEYEPAEEPVEDQVEEVSPRAATASAGNGQGAGRGGYGRERRGPVGEYPSSHHNERNERDRLGGALTDVIRVRSLRP